MVHEDPPLLSDRVGHSRSLGSHELMPFPFFWGRRCEQHKKLQPTLPEQLSKPTCLSSHTG
jgi:hypothetical protein